MALTSSGGGCHLSEAIEQRRVLFEQTWGQPSAPSIEQLLDELPKVEHPDLLRELLYVEFEFKQRNAADLSLENYLSRFPEYEAIVREVADAIGQYTVFKHRSVAGYTLLNELGRGGMGVVYRAKSDLLNKFVAFKIVSQRVIGNPEALCRFKRELEMNGRLKHPNIVEAKHADIAPDGSPFLVMEFVEGITLNEWSKQNPPSVSLPSTESDTEIVASNPSSILSGLKKVTSEQQPGTPRIVQACTIIHHAAQGLQAIHEAGLVHRDIKPGNIMLQPDGRVKILDLGLAKVCTPTAEQPSVTQHGQFIGTPGYMAPEQYSSAVNVDIRADIYSLGCTFFFLLYGRPPSMGRPKDLPTSVPKKVLKILDRMLAADPGARFQEPREVVAALDAFLGAQKKVRWKKIAAALVAIVCVGVVMALFVTYDNQREVQPLIATTKPVVPLEQPTPEDILIILTERFDKAVVLFELDEFIEAENALKDLYLDLSTRYEADKPSLYAKVLSAQGDCTFFSTFATHKTVKRVVDEMKTRYEVALNKAKLSQDESLDILRAKLPYKLAVVTAGEENSEYLIPDNAIPSLYLNFAKAVVSAKKGDYQPLRDFVETKMIMTTEPGVSASETKKLWEFAIYRLQASEDPADKTVAQKKMDAFTEIFGGELK